MPPTLDVPTFRNREEIRRYIEARTSRSIEDLPSVHVWRFAGRASLTALLVYAALQYYFLHVFVEIMALPALTTFAG
jgi:hypothetical protein